MPELSLTFLGSEFTCLVSAFRAPSKLACHLPYLLIANNPYSWGKSRDSQYLLKRQRTSKVFYLHFFILQVRNLRSREVKHLLQGVQLLGSGVGEPSFPASVKWVLYCLDLSCLLKPSHCWSVRKWLINFKANLWIPFQAKSRIIFRIWDKNNST